MERAIERRVTLSCSLGQNLVDHSAADVGQTEVAALETVGQPFVVDAQQMQHRGVQVVDVHDVFDGVVAEFVGGCPS